MHLALSGMKYATYCTFKVHVGS